MTHTLLLSLGLSALIMLIFESLEVLVNYLSFKYSPGYERFTNLQLFLLANRFRRYKYFDKWVYNGDIERSVQLEESILSRIELLKDNCGMEIGLNSAKVVFKLNGNHYDVRYHTKKDIIALRPIFKEDIEKVVETISNIEYNLVFNDDIKIFQ